MTGSIRFFQGFPWRFIVTTLDSETTTSLERLASNREVVFRLNQPAYTTGRVPSNDPRINIVDVEPGFDAPHLSFADRLMFGFRREAVDPSSWVCRFGGIVTQLEDQSGPNQPYSTYSAYDPWQYFFHRRVLDGTGDIGTTGLTYNAPGNEIVDDLLTNALTDGDLHIDWDSGDWETTPTLEITFQQGTSLGAALQQVVQTGGIDIVFEPTYDPVANPGVCCTVMVYAQAGTTQDAAVFSWDVGRTVHQVTNLLDGENMANEVRYHNGQGGPLVTPQEDATSISRYGIYTTEQFFPAQVQDATVEAYAAWQLSLRSQGRRTVTLSPNPLLSPKPFLDYGLGDRVPVYATDRLRQAIPWANASTVYQRVYGIPITLGDDGVETVTRLLASPDGFS